MQKSRRSKIITIATMFALVINIFNLNVAKAASITNAKDVVSSMRVSTLSTHAFTFTTPTGVAASQTITITFPAGYALGATAFGDIDLTDDGVDLALAATATGATWGAAVTGQVLTLTNGSAAVAAASVLTVEIGANATFGVAGVTRITNPVAAASNVVFTIAGTFGDTGSLATAILANDQISVSGTIAPTLSFAMGTVTPDNSIGFGTMSSSSVTYATDNLVGTTTATDTGAYGVATANSVRLAASTNGNGGLSISLRDQGNGVAGGLYNSGAAKNITAVAPNVTLAAGTEGYQIFGVQAGQTAGAAFSVAAGFTKTTGTTAVSMTPAVFASCTGPVNAARADVVVASAITAMTPAGAYVDTLTFTATANF